MCHTNLSRIWIFTVIWILLVLHSTQGVYQPFNCRRPSTLCRNGARCQIDGTCDCPNAAEGADCGLNTASLAPQMCQGRPCFNGGSCYFDGTIHRCYCTAEFYGDQCENHRVSVTCSNGSMVAYVNPYANQGFTGSIYIFGLPLDQNCRFQPTTTPNLEGYELTLPLVGTGPCSQRRKQLTINGNPVYQYEAFVKYDRIITTAVDERHVLQCEFKLNGTLSASTSTGFNETVFQTLTGTNARRGYQPVTMVIKDLENNTVSNPVLVGSRLVLQFELPENELVYTGYIIDSCTAFSTEGNVSTITQEYPLLENNCPAASASAIAPNINAWNRVTRLQFSAFKFDATSLVNFVCQLTLCDVNSTNECDFNYDTCATNVNKRRRRQAVTRYLKTDVIGQTLLVVEVLPQTSPANTVVYSCDMVYFYIVLAVLAFFALLTLICAVYLCYKMLKRRKRYDTVVVKKFTLPNGQQIHRVEEVLPAEVESTDLKTGDRI